MTGTQMLDEFKIGFDIVASGLAPGFPEAHIYSILNRAEENIIEEDLKKKDFSRIYPLVVQVVHTACPAYSLYQNRAQVAFPSDYWAFVTAYVYGAGAGTGNRTMPPSTGVVRNPNDPDAFTAFKSEVVLASPIEFERFNYDDNESWKDFRNMKHRTLGTLAPYQFNSASVYTKALNLRANHYTNIVQVNIDYIKTKNTISSSVDSSLPSMFHRDVVDKAIDLAKIIINVQQPQQTQ